LREPTFNRDFAAKQMKRVVEIIAKTNDYEIVRTGDGNNGWILLYTYVTKTADYIVKYNVRRWNWIAPTVTQCLVWADSRVANVRGITAKMFF
jgi:hypothetical protein